MGGFVGQLQGMLKEMGCPVSSAEDTAKAAELVGELRTQFEAETGNEPNAEADAALIRPFALVHALMVRVLNGPQVQKKDAATKKHSTAQPLNETPAAPIDAPAGAPEGDGEIDCEEITGQKKSKREKSDKNQVHILMGFMGPKTSGGDYFAFRVLDNILSGGMDSRLFTELREKRNL